MAEDQITLGRIEFDVPTPMRDGTILRSHVFYPKDDGPRPVLLHRTPYGKASSAPGGMIEAGYVVMSQDIRGRYASDGEWIPFSEPDTPDGIDGYDTIEWIAAQPWCDGNVGTFGASYDAWVQWQAARHRPPHLRAMVAYTIPMELQDLDYPGMFQLARRMNWWFSTMAPDLRKRAGMSPPHTRSEGRETWEQIEQGLKLATVPVVSTLRGLPPALRQYAETQVRDPARPAWTFAEAHNEVDVPNLDFTGWFDHCYSAGHLASMQQRGRSEAARTQSQLRIGPSNHGSHGMRSCAGFDFGPHAGFNKNAAMIEWFDFWLKGIDNGVGDRPQVRYFVLGAGEWKTTSTWPPPDGDKALTLHLSSGGELREKPVESAADTYTYDPVDPTPTVWGPGVVPVPYDRSRLDYRHDVLRYRTAPLEADVEVAGCGTVTLFAASTAPDTDFFVHLCDEGPDGTALEVDHGKVRARHRNGLDRNDPITPGSVVKYTIRLRGTACRFRKGHRIRLDIASANFPYFDRNHNTGGNDLLEAEMRPADQTVHHGGAQASCVVLPLA